MAIRTALQTQCDGNHEYNDNRGMDVFKVTVIGDRRFTVCAHQIGTIGYCGQLIDITDLDSRVICCGNHS